MVTVACGLLRPDTPYGDRVAVALDIFAPDVALGKPVSASLALVPSLTLEDYTGYAAPAYASRDGYGHLLVVVEDAQRWAFSEGDHPPGYYRVADVVLSAENPGSATKAEARLRSLLGEPEEICWQEFWGGLNRLLYWEDPGGGTVQLVVPVGPWEYRGRDVTGEWIEQRRTILTISVEKLPRVTYTFSTCEDAPPPDPWRFTAD
jgi:hypothetical protein